MLRKFVMAAALVGSLAMASRASAQTTTVYNFGSSICVSSTNCIVYANNETQWFWWHITNDPSTTWVLFELASWDPEYHATNQFVCGSATATAGEQDLHVGYGTCTNIDMNGVPFALSYSFVVTSFKTTGSSGRGAGYNRTRYRITELTVSITQ